MMTATVTAIMAPGLLAPGVVAVVGPDWRVDGAVIQRAPYSVQVRWTGPDGERTAWFGWEPARPVHMRQHGVSDAFALRIEAAE